MRKNSIKNTRVNQEVQKELSMLISRELKDPRINPMTSIVNVEVAPDLKTCKVFISVLGDAQSQQDTLKGLKSAAPFLRSQLAHGINLRNTPELTFYVDQSIEYGVNMSRLIDEVNAKSGNLEEDLEDDADTQTGDEFESEQESEEEF